MLHSVSVVLVLAYVCLGIFLGGELLCVGSVAYTQLSV